MKMSKNRFKISTSTTYITEQSREIGDFDRHEDVREYVFEKLSDVADYIVDAAVNGMNCFNGMNSFIFEDNDWNQDYRTGEESRDSFHVMFGKNVDTELNKAALKIYVCRALERRNIDVESFLQGN